MSEDWGMIPCDSDKNKNNISVIDSLSFSLYALRDETDWHLTSVILREYSS